jgi:lactate dehydrogenase-like 2-hydroxyacid dehydrogenase
MRKRIVVYKKLSESELAKLERFFDVTQFALIDNDNRISFLEAIKPAHGLLGASAKFTEEMLSGADHLEAISTISVGYDNFDVPWLTERGIILTNTPDVLTETVADTIFALMLASARRVVELAEFVKAGHWNTASVKRFMASMSTQKHSAFSEWVGSAPASLDVHDSASEWKFSITTELETEKSKTDLTPSFTRSRIFWALQIFFVSSYH